MKTPCPACGHGGQQLMVPLRLEPRELAPGASATIRMHLPREMKAVRLVGFRLSATLLLLKSVQLHHEELLLCPLDAYTFSGMLAEQLRPFRGVHVWMHALELKIVFENPTRQRESIGGALLVEYPGL